MVKKGRPAKFLGLDSILLYDVLQCLDIARVRSPREVLRELEKKGLGELPNLTPIKGVLAKAEHEGLAKRSWDKYGLTSAGVDRVLSDRLRIFSSMFAAFIADMERKGLDDAAVQELDAILPELKKTIRWIYRKPKSLPETNLGSSIPLSLEVYWRKVPKEFLEIYAEYYLENQSTSS